MPSCITGGVIRSTVTESRAVRPALLALRFYLPSFAETCCARLAGAPAVTGRLESPVGTWWR